MQQHHPAIIELVKFLARYCAERDYEEFVRNGPKPGGMQVRIVPKNDTSRKRQRTRRPIPKTS